MKILKLHNTREWKKHIWEHIWKIKPAILVTSKFYTSELSNDMIKLRINIWGLLMKYYENFEITH
jgi:hypothetical protein